MFDLAGAHLGYKVGLRKCWKHCGICGEPVQSQKVKLKRHCARQHVNEFVDIVENEGFLRRGRLPSHSKYKNF